MQFIVNSVEAKRTSKNPPQPMNISNNSTLTAVSKAGDKLSVGFKFMCNYEPDVGFIRVEGEVLVEGPAENIDKALEEWAKSNGKNLPREMAEHVHNVILTNCIVEATVLSREVRLPAPIPLPRVAINNEAPVSDYDVSHYIR